MVVVVVVVVGFVHDLVVVVVVGFVQDGVVFMHDGGSIAHAVLRFANKQQTKTNM